MAIWLKKHGHCDKFIADFRDPLYNPGFRDKKIEAEYDKRCLKKVLDYADEVVCVTKGISDGIQKIFPKYDKQQIKVLTNGFDRDDLSNDTVVEPFDVRVNFVYTGTLYHGKRCVNMLACVLKELIESSTICKNDFRFQYAGPDFEELLSQLSEYDLEDTAVDHGFVSRDESIALQKQASALLLLTWNEVSYQGVVPGKLYEYMAIGDVPIIGLITGDVCNSEAASIINDTSMGCVAEAANWEKDKDKLRSFTKNLFSDKGTVLGNPNKYSYQVIAKEYSEIIRGKNKND